MKTETLNYVLVISAIVTLIITMSGGLYWILKHKIMEEMYKVFVHKNACRDNHKVTDVMIKAMKEKMDDVGEKVNKIVDYLMTGKRIVRKKGGKK